MHSVGQNDFHPAGEGLIEIMLLCPQRNCLPCTLVNLRAMDLGVIQLSSLNLEFSGLEGIPKPVIKFFFFHIFFLFGVFFSLFSGDSF